MAKRKPSEPRATPVASIRHKDKRANIPTEELRDFVAEDEKAPKTMLYPRDPSLDPQLVWKGKDEQDQKDLAVPVVPVYIQEKIHPHALIEDLRRTAPSPSKGEGRGEGSGIGDQLDLFADFNGLDDDFDKKVDFYQHEQSWTNRMILGDSLLVMTSLAEKEGLKGKVQTIYFDPPYGIKFGSNWQVSTRKRDVKDGKAEDCTRQPEQIRAFRDCWRIGVHSYLAYIRDILTVARELLTETGSIFVQIGDENVHLVRCALDEVFGSENFCSLIPFRKKTMPMGASLLEQMADYLVWYARDKERVKYRGLFLDKSFEGDNNYRWFETADGVRHDMTAAQVNDHQSLPAHAEVFHLKSLEPSGPMASGRFDFELDGKKYPAPANGWATTPNGMARLAAARRLKPLGDALRYVLFGKDYGVTALTNPWNDVSWSGFAEEKIYAVQTNTQVVRRCLLMTTDPGDLVLDPTCGSGTTAFVAEQWGRRWITIDTSRVALALARTRLMAAKYAYYHLADDYPQMTQMNTDDEIRSYLRKSVQSVDHSSADIRKGFVYKRVPHVTLKSIANNPDIREGMTREQIDAAIARHAESETLYDQPYEDNKRIRVTGPFTVESLSPHRVLSTDDTDEHREKDASAVRATPSHLRPSVKPVDDFAFMIIENLRKAGVQNTKKNERLKFDSLDSFAGAWIHAFGEYTENNPQITQIDTEKRKANQVDSSVSSVDSIVRRVAVSIGPEHGTVGPLQVKEAAKEAVQGVGFDVLIICGFAFDPHVSEEAKRYGKLTVLAARMNPDLAMGDELLKKTGAGNLFMVFGEPDIDIRRVKSEPGAQATGQSEPRPSGSGPLADARGSEKIVVEIKGVDVYDPTTGQIRSSSTDDIACWFIDTEYNGESFFVRHAYFTGAAKDGDGPYDKLKRALRAEIDEAAWSALYSTTSRPFDAPSTGKIAVKVINHYGDEVLKVFEM